MDRTNGYLTGEEKVLLRRMVVHATSIINTASSRLCLSPSEVLDEHVNSWWRNYDKELDLATTSLLSDFQKYKQRGTPQ